MEHRFKCYSKYYPVCSLNKRRATTMEQMQAAPTLPHIVQVYQPAVSIHPSLQTSQGKVTYKQTITSESLHIPVSHNIQNQQLLAQSQTAMSCQQIHLQSVHQQMQTQVLQTAECQPLIASHVILPQVPVFKQHMLTNSVPQTYYGQYEYVKEQCVISKVESSMTEITEKQNDCNPEATETVEIDVMPVNKRCRRPIPNPNKWACNVRKIKHQRGEAYISRRGKYVAERRVKNTKDCLKTCKFKCNERVNDSDRQDIFKAFYSLNANEKKHFLLNTTERNYVKHNKLSNGNHKRKYSFKYTFLVRAVRYIVCKNFYLGTLAISQKPIYNVHMSKSEMNLPKPDGRGLSEASSHSIPTEVKDTVRKHIMSFPTLDTKPIKQFSRKKQYLESNLSIKQMYTMYYSECGKENLVTVKESMYRKIFKQEFNLFFKRDKGGQPVCCRCKGPAKKKKKLNE